jgi:cytochrome P450
MESAAAEEIERWPLGERIRIWPRMQAVTLEVILRAVFGVAEGERLGRLRSELRSVLDLLSNPRQMGALALMGPERIADSPRFQRVMEPVNRLVYEEIEARRNAPDVAEREDILSLLLQARHEDGEPMSDRELRDELMTLLVAGHETTATSLAWAIERLVRHPDKLARLADETIAGDEDYLDAVIKETLRLRPVVSIVLRRLTEPMQIGEWLLPAGASIVPCIYLVHRRPDIYPEPDRFLPERFLETPPGTYTWIPFGGGVRRCLGAAFAEFEMSVVLRELVARRTIRPSRLEPERMVRRAITMVPRRGAEVVVEAAPRRDGPPSPRPERAAVPELAGPAPR